MSILTTKEIQEEALKLLNDAFHDTYLRPKGQNEVVHCALPFRVKKIGEESSEQLTEVAQEG
jgi:hypothetical protein